MSQFATRFDPCGSQPIIYNHKSQKGQAKQAFTWQLTVAVIGSTLVALGCLFGSTQVQSAEGTEPPLVRTADVEIWHEGFSQVLYCVVDTPFIYQAASHSDAELLHILPTGSRVVAGQLIAKQDNFYLQQDLSKLEIDQRLASAELKHARNEHKRLSVLDRKKMIANSQLSQAALILTTAQLKLESIENETKTQQRRINRLQHRAPFDAEVLGVTAKPGEQIALGQKLYQLLPVNQKQLECQLPLNIATALNLTNLQASKLKDKSLAEDLSFTLKPQNLDHTQLSQSTVDTQTTVNTAAGKAELSKQNTKPLKLREISQTLDVDSQNLRLYFDYKTDNKQPLLVGQRVQIQMHQQHNDITRVPYDAVSLAGSSYLLWSLNDNNTVSKINPKILSTTKDAFIIRSPLRAGDKVIVRGQKNLTELQVVRPSGEAS